MKTILVPIDFSEASDRVIDAARTLAQVIDARIVLMHVGAQSEAYAALPTMIAYLREQGFTFVRADRILEP